MTKVQLHRWAIVATVIAVSIITLVYWHGHSANKADAESPGDNESSTNAFSRTALSIAITGNNFQWEIVYPGRDGELGTQDDLRSQRNLDVPAGTKITLLLTSEDYIYTFRVNELGINEMAIPEMEFTAKFGPVDRRTYELLGDQMCGYSHPDLLAKLVVLSRTEFAARMKLLEANGPLNP